MGEGQGEKQRGRAPHSGTAVPSLGKHPPHPQHPLTTHFLLEQLLNYLVILTVTSIN